MRLGVLAPIPDGNPVGGSMVAGAKLAAEEINADGGVLGAEVAVEVGDTQANPGTGREEYRRLVREAECDATFGIFLTQVLLQCLEPISQTRTPHLTVGAAGPEPARRVAEDYERFKYHFRVGPLNALDLADATLEFLDLHADRLGWERGALVVENAGAFDPYYERVADGIDEHIEATTEQTSPGTSNWSPIFEKVEEQGADVLIVGQALSGTASVVQWGRQQRPFAFGGLHVPGQLPGFYEETGGDCEYSFTMNAVTPGSQNTDRTQVFVERYREANGRYPAPTGAMAYDAVGIYADAVGRAVREEGLSTLPDGDALVPYLEETSFTEGTVLPEFRFTGSDAEFAHDPAWTCTAGATCGDDAAGVPLWHQWQSEDGEGVQAVFAPDRNATAEYQPPPWL